MRLKKQRLDREKDGWRSRMPRPCFRELLSMRLFAGSLLAVAFAGSIWAQRPTDSGSVSAGASQHTDSGNAIAETTAPVVDTTHQRQESFGSGDVIKVSVYDSPELTGNVGVNS